MMRAYHVFWWNKLSGKESEELDVMIITDTIDNVFNLFRRDFPGKDVNLIQNVECMTSVVVV